MLKEITQECYEEYISMCALQMEWEIVEHLCILRDDISDIETKKFLQKYIDNYAEEHKVCKKCLIRLDPIEIREYHSHLPGLPYETLINGYRCSDCGRKYNY